MLAVGQLPAREKSEPACFDHSESLGLSGKWGEGDGKVRFDRLTCLELLKTDLYLYLQMDFH